MVMTSSATATALATVLLKSAVSSYQQQQQKQKPTKSNSLSLPDDRENNQFILIQNNDNVVNIRINNSQQREISFCDNTNDGPLNTNAVSKVQIQSKIQSSSSLSMFHEIPQSSGCIRINLTTKHDQLDPYLSNSMYYVENLSGQCSPSDTLDSGTCSDLDGTPPPLPKKKNIKLKKTTTVVNETLKQQNNRHQQIETIDSDEADSNVSYDSLNSATTDDDQTAKTNGFLPKKLLEDIRDKQKCLKGIPDIKTTIYRTQKEQYDNFYEFHLKENEIDERPENFELNTVNEIDETFAGVKTIPGSEKLLKSETIRSSKGTIRGVKNRVRAGIATFLQIQSTEPNYKEKDLGKIVVYTTTMGIVRDTYQKCVKVKQILRTLMVKFEERDVFMSYDYQVEIRTRLKSANILVPQLFIDGIHIGDSEIVERLNESGELRKILKPFKSLDACNTCQVCGGFRLLPCPICNGSKKSVHRNHFTTEFVALKCMNCDEVGLVRCTKC